MTNPGNIVRVRARNGGRASVYEANGWAQAFTSGLVSGNGVKQNTLADMNVLVGGSSTKPDVVLGENPAGYKIALDLVGQQPLAITAPASNSRISAIVAYTDDLALPTTEDTVTGSPASCGLIVVNGTTAANPTNPTDAQIRTAITADGATGSQAAYCIIATVLVSNNTTTITDGEITNNNIEVLPKLPVNSVDNSNINDNAVTASKIDFSTIDASYISSGTLNLGYGLTVPIHRIGNICVVSISKTLNATIERKDDLITQIVPSGFRPAVDDEAVITGLVSAGNSLGTGISWFFKNDGRTLISNPSDKTGNNRYALSGVWFTNDPYPIS